MQNYIDKNYDLNENFWKENSQEQDGEYANF